MTPWTKTRHTNFQVNRTNGQVVKACFMFFSYYSATMWQIAAIFLLLPHIELIHMCTEFGEDTSFTSGVIAILVK